MRITVDLEPIVLRELEALQRRAGRSLGSLMSELLAEALFGRAAEAQPMAPFVGARKKCTR